MNLNLLPRIAPRAIGLGLFLAAGAAGLAFADTAAPVPNKGDTAWMLTSSALVLMMSIPGLALFYAGMARPKNTASLAAQVFAIVAMVGIIWCIYGYSLAFTEGATNWSRAPAATVLGSDFCKAINGTISSADLTGPFLKE